MLDFILKLSGNKNFHDLKIEANQNTLPAGKDENVLRFFYCKPSFFNKFEDERYKAFILGDLIIPKGHDSNIFLKTIFNNFSAEKLQTLKGNFYLVLFDKNEKNITFFNSLFSILPIYYLDDSNTLMVSSSIQLIKKYCSRNLSISKKFLVEKLLFNYAFLDATIYTQIKLLPSNHYLVWNKKKEFIKHTDIKKFFTDNPADTKDALDRISEVFITNLQNYFPPDYFYLTLTGGFDSRTIVAAAYKNELNFSTFSYGGAGTQDLMIPEQIATNLGFMHEKFVLDQNYAQTQYLNNLESLIFNTDCNTSISRSHYAFIADQLSTKTDYFLSGNFGSDILRTTREGGVISSNFLLKLFEIDDKDLLFAEMLNTSVLNVINKDLLRIELEEIFDEILKYKQSTIDITDKNKKYYLYEFEEVYRKYFGPEFVIQNYFGISNRAPYLDFNFIKELLKTKLAGVNSRYMEKNPLLRFKGQILYAKILERLNSPLHHLALDKGYKPKDFFTIQGKINIAYYYLLNRLRGKRYKNFSLYNEICFNQNKSYFKSLMNHEDIFCKDIIEDELSRYNGKLNHVFAFLIYTNKFN